MGVRFHPSVIGFPVEGMPIHGPEILTTSAFLLILLIVVRFLHRYLRYLFMLSIYASGSTNSRVQR
jgi:hypothetical protein